MNFRLGWVRPRCGIYDTIVHERGAGPDARAPASLLATALLQICAHVRNFFGLVLVLNFGASVLFYVSFSTIQDTDDDDPDVAPHLAFATLAKTMWTL